MFQWLKDLWNRLCEPAPVRPTPPDHPGTRQSEPGRNNPMYATGGTLKIYEEPAVAYASHPEAVIVACFFNPQNSPYRLLAFQKWYKSIKHLNHRIIECLIGENAKKQLPDSPYIITVETDSLLFHKEALLNKVIAELPTSFQYVFWLDTDVLFTNPNWLVAGVRALQNGANIIQPFEYCVHMKRNELKPSFNVDSYRHLCDDPNKRNPEMWRSFCANFMDNRELTLNHNYDIHGHVGFAWGARRDVLDMVQLYDKALIGGADHIIAHAAANQIPCHCISRAFTLELDDVTEWSKQFAAVAKGKVDFVTGDLYHIWHGDIKDREYLKRIREFAAEAQFITRRDKNGLWIYDGNNPYMKQYYRKREAVYSEVGYDGFDAGFIEDMGYALVNLSNIFGQPTYEDEAPAYTEPVVETSSVETSSVEPSTTQPYEPGHFDYTPPGDYTPPVGTVTESVPEPAPVQSFTPSYEPGHWDYTPPGGESPNFS